VVVMQRSSADLRLNPHLHGVFLDGVYVMESDGVPGFRALSHLSTSDVADVLKIARARIVRLLQRRGVLSADAEATGVDEEFAHREPALAELATAAVSGLPLAGPEIRRRPIEIPLRGKPGVVVTRPRCVEEMGFTLHADTRAGAEDDRGREALLEYVLRPPIANENVQEGPRGWSGLRSRELSATAPRPWTSTPSLFFAGSPRWCRRLACTPFGTRAYSAPPPSGARS
jgi:hypothetical protein